MQDVESLPLEELDVVGPATYAAHGYPHAAWARLRREDPVHWVDRGVVNPFWAVTKHADVIWLSRQPARFLNRPRLAVFPDFGREPPPPSDDPFARHLLNMDPPDHAAYRRVAAFRLTPRAVRRLEPSVEAITKDLLDEAVTGGETREGDFVELFASKLPLIVLADLLGVPREDWERMFRWTNETIGSTDPEFRGDDRTAGEAIHAARNALFQYFYELAEKRRKEPRDDLVSVIANAKVDGQPLPPLELLSYYFLLVVAGNETTRNALSGGLLALLENPGELAKLRRDPRLAHPAAEEIVRWTSPVIQFCRTATEEVELRGKRIRPGDNLCLFYPSANRDEEVFDAPNAFRVDRKPNPHLAFGIGEHYCLGANLARMEIRVALRQLVARMEHVELAGEIERLRSSFVGGIKRVPIRYRLRAA